MGSTNMRVFKLLTLAVASFDAFVVPNNHVDHLAEVGNFETRLLSPKLRMPRSGRPKSAKAKTNSKEQDTEEPKNTQNAEVKNPKEPQDTQKSKNSDAEIP